jgi:hypothetical protein
VQCWAVKRAVGDGRGIIVCDCGGKDAIVFVSGGVVVVVEIGVADIFHLGHFMRVERRWIIMD